MAPMVGLSTRPFRILALRHGCALAAGEMLNSEYLVRAGPEERERIRVRPDEHPAALQIVGARREAMSESAAILEDLGADVLDVNMGCPVKRITKGGGGVALMDDFGKAARIVAELVRRVRVPVTVKIRAGGADASRDAAEFARVLVQAGARAVAIHARTKSARHRGAPMLDAIRRVKAAVDVPVIGNGGIRAPEDAAAMLEATGCDGVMIGRGAIGDVWLFERTARYLATGDPGPDPSGEEKLAVFAEHLRLMVEEYGERDGVVRFRKCVPHYLKGMPGAREGRRDLVGEPRADAVIERAREILTPTGRPGEARVPATPGTSP